MNEIERLLQEIDAEMSATRRWHGCDALSPATRMALQQTPRERFIPDALGPSAYENRPLPIGHRQTISQPYIVALMTELLRLRPDDVILEIGTGSGYQAAVLAQLVAHVHSIEVIPELAARAQMTLEELGVDNVTVHVADGNSGWPECAPYDGIIVTAAAPTLPPDLMGQLKVGRQMIIPLGQAEWGQELRLFTRHPDGEVDERHILPVVFVPLVSNGPANA